MSPYLNMLEIINYDIKITNMLIIGNKMVSNWPKYRGAWEAPRQFRAKNFSQKYFFDQLIIGISNFGWYHRNQRFFAVIFIYLTRFFRKFARKFFLSIPKGSQKIFFVKKFFFLHQKTIISIIKFRPLRNF